MSHTDAVKSIDGNGRNQAPVTGITAPYPPAPKILMNHQLDSAERVREETS